MRSLSFVDRMVAPWVTAAQRSAGLRMFSQYNSAEVPERAITGVSWVFPRPWYQDELDWISASRANQAGQDMIFTTRGTYAAAADRRRESLPAHMLEYVAPSFAPSSPEAASAYSPLVSHSSYSAASVVAQSMQAIQTASAMARGLPVRSVEAAGAMAPVSAMVPSSMNTSFGSLAPLVSSLIPDGESSRFAMSGGPSALAMRAPQLVTPPSPRAEGGEGAAAAAEAAQQMSEHAVQAQRSEREAQVARAAAEVTARQEQSRAMAVAFAQERERVAEQMRVQARVERERAAAAPVERAPAAAAAAPSQAEVAAREAFRAEAIRMEATRVERATASRVQSSARQQARIDAIVAERMARLEMSSASAAAPSGESPSVEASSVSSSVSSPMAAAQPSEAQSQAMVQALRMAELLAHAAAVGPSAMAPAAGPRMAMPSGLGGLVAGMNTVAVIHRERQMANEPTARRENAPLPFASGFQPVFAAPMAFAAADAPSAAANDERAVASASSSGAPAMARASSPMIPPVAAWAPRAFAPEAMRTDSALGAIASSAPAALSHVAWADRWLGRFAGASEASLDAMSTISMRARLAPAQSFLAPMMSEAPRAETIYEAPSRSSYALSAPSLDVVAPRRAEAPIAAPSSSSTVTPAAAAEAPRSQPSALRFADDDVVSDDVFAAIAAAAPPRREAARPTTTAPTAARPGAAPTAAPLPPQQFARVPQLTAADMVAMTAPSAPVDAGLSASLAASPMAPALGHVLSLPRAAVFDTRSLGGAELAAAFLAGSVNAPMVAQYSFGGAANNAGRIGSFGGVTSPLWSEAGAGDDVAAPSLWRQWSAELVRPAELTRSASRDEVRFDGRADSAYDVISSAQRPTAAAASAPAASAPAAAAATSPAAAAIANENIITLRSTLLAPASPRQQRLAASAGTVASWANQEAIDSLPVAYQTLGELLQEASPDRRWLSSMSTLAPMSTMPGGIAEATLASAQGWDEMAAPPRFDQGFPLVFWPLANAPATAGFAERFAEATAASYASTPAAAQAAAQAASRGARAAAPQVASSAVDFDASIMAPALVEQGLPGTMDRGALSPGMLAQRALGFGAVQSSQAADLSFDFVPPELVLAARVYGFGPAEAAQAARLAMGGATGLSAMAGAVDLRFVSLMGPMSPAQGRGEAREEARGFGAPSEMSRPQEAREQDAAFGVARRTPRGAFLLPSASVAAMGLSAALPEGEHSMSIAALEVLAAKMVAELGSFASPALLAAAAAETGAGPSASPARRAPSATMLDISQPARPEAIEASEAEVLSSAATSISSSRRARFESLYVALAESSAGRTMSPAARAARALALANRDEDATTLSSRERAALAWQIFPVVLNGEAAPVEAGASSEAREQRGSSAQQRGRMELPTVSAASPADRPGAEMRPGLAPLSSRAGEALSSFVTAAPSSSGSGASSSSDNRSSNAWRSGRYGGGEVEIPGWFEAAARKMFEDRGDVEGISLAELTLVASTPPSQIAASDRASAPSAAPKQASPDGKGEKGQKVDIESVAADVYRAVMQMMESARMRNGEPFL